MPPKIGPICIDLDILLCQYIYYYILEAGSVDTIYKPLDLHQI